MDPIETPSSMCIGLKGLRERWHRGLCLPKAVTQRKGEEKQIKQRVFYDRKVKDKLVIIMQCIHHIAWLAKSSRNS